MSSNRRPDFKNLPQDDGPSFEVGHKKPPRGSRFQPSQSGNPTGRPKGARNKREPDGERLRAIIREEAYRNITVTDGNRKPRIPVSRAAVRTMALNAAKGQMRSTQLLMRLSNETEAADQLAKEKYWRSVIEYEQYWERELELRKLLGIIAPDPIPHPDNIIIDYRKGEISIKGPLTKEEAKEFEFLRGCIRDLDLAMEYCQSELDRGIRGKRRPILTKYLEDFMKMRAAIISIVGAPATNGRSD